MKLSIVGGGVSKGNLQRWSTKQIKSPTTWSGGCNEEWFRALYGCLIRPERYPVRVRP